MWDQGDRLLSPSLPSSEVLKPLLLLANVRQERHCIFITDFAGLQSSQNNFTCYLSQFLQQPCEVVDKYFHPCFVEGEIAFQEGECCAPSPSFLFLQWSWVWNQSFLSSYLDPIILLHPRKSGFKDSAFRIKSGKVCDLKALIMWISKWYLIS